MSEASQASQASAIRGILRSIDEDAISGIAVVTIGPAGDINISFQGPPAPLHAGGSELCRLLLTTMFTPKPKADLS